MSVEKSAYLSENTDSVLIFRSTFGDAQLMMFFRFSMPRKLNEHIRPA